MIIYLSIAIPHRNNLEQEVSLLPLILYFGGLWLGGLLGEGMDNVQNNNPAVKHCLGYAVAHLVEALCYKPVGSPTGVIGIYFTDLILGSPPSPKRNKYQVYLLGCKGGRCVGL